MAWHQSTAFHVFSRKSACGESFKFPVSFQFNQNPVMQLQELKTVEQKLELQQVTYKQIPQCLL